MGVASRVAGLARSAGRHAGGWRQDEGAHVGNRLEVDEGDVRRAARQADADADAVAAVPHHREANALATALPGSASAASARRLASVWSAASEAWVADSRAYAQNLQASAAALAATDQRSGQGLSRLASRLGSVPR